MNLWAFIETFNSREKALAVWILLFFAWVFFRNDTRKSALGVIKAFFHRKITSVVVAMLLYIIMIVLLLSTFGLWNIGLLKETVFWVLGTAFVLLLSADKATRNASFFKEVVINELKLVVVLEFIANFYTLNFWIEMLLIPVIVVMSAMGALAEVRPKYRQARKVIGSILALIGFSFFIYALGQVIANFHNFATLQTLLTFALPSLLTLAYIPFLYIFALIIAYETLFIRLSIFIKDKELLNFAKLRIFLLCSFNLGLLNRFAQNTGADFIRIKNKQNVLKMIESFKNKKR